MSGATKAMLVRVEFDTGSTGRIYATSPDMKGLMVGRRSMEELEAVLPKAIQDMYAAGGVRVVVTRLETKGEDDTSVKKWIAFPAEIARRELALADANV